MRQKIIAGNWKMNTSYQEALKLAEEVTEFVKEGVNAKVILCPPFPYLGAVKERVVNSGIGVGAQNCSKHMSGAYTGEVSATMLRSMEISYVILGHSERRQYFRETGKLLSQKVDSALANGLIPIYCCGELLEARELGEHKALIKQQIEEGLFHLNRGAVKKAIIAYEPVWAIGTGKTATTEQAQEIHRIIRDHLALKFGKEVSDLIPIIYGGSVKPDNAKELFACPDVDGGLVGGASLKSTDFAAIVHSA